MANNNDDWIEKLDYSVRSTVRGFSDYAKRKIKEKIDNGYKISQATSGEIEVFKGYSYYGIDQGGSVYAK